MTPANPHDALASVLDLARWAPSGDNTQPWQFSISARDKVAIFGHDTRTHCVYDLDGHASQISLGALLESISLAATRFGLTVDFARRPDLPIDRPVFDATFRSVEGLAEHRLVACIPERRVQRRPLSLRSLSEHEKQELEMATGPHYRIAWFERWAERWRMAWLGFCSAKLRLTLPEAYRVHREVIEWNARFSEDRIPDAALGAGPLSLVLMRWAMADWKRITWLNRYFAGTLAPRIELDLIPGLACAAHCALIAPKAPMTLDDYVAVGRALQRFWLTATSLGLQFQPQYTPLIFARYARESVQFAQDPQASKQAKTIRAMVDDVFGPRVASQVVFMGRIGHGTPASARSTRRSLERLLEPSQKPASVSG